jgi:hypothetical protein
MAPASSSATIRNPAFAALKARLDAVAAPRVRIEDVTPSGVSALDDLLGGGFPNGALVTLEGTAGRWSIATRLLAQVTVRSTAAIVDDGSLYPPDLARAGVRLDRVLVVPARLPLVVARAADVLVRSKACRLVLVTAPELKAQLWARLATVAHRTGVLLVAVTPPHPPHALTVPLSAAAGVRLHCTRERAVVSGKRGLWCSFSGYDVCAELRKHAGGISERRALLEIREDARAALR